MKMWEILAICLSKEIKPVSAEALGGSMPGKESSMDGVEWTKKRQGVGVDLAGPWRPL